MPVKLNPTSVIKARLGIEPNGRVQKYFQNQCYRYMDKYVPKDMGNLRTIVNLDGESITYMSPYASYQYYGIRADGTHAINPENYTTPGTGPKWDERMLSVDTEKIIKNVQKFIERET